MRKSTLLLPMLIVSASSFAQEVVSTQGESYANANGSIEFTIGEVVTNTITNGNETLTQGFHQTNWNFLGLDDFQPDYQAMIYPNPTQDFLNIKANDFKYVSYVIHDAQGRIVASDNLLDETTSIVVSDWANGAYSITLQNKSELLKTFKLIKNY